ncbi:HAD hydrolase subfamily IA REG-2-like protein [Mrakia frigida]|uniref:Dpi35p n=1 Tax=Mrakia frigida TaxID=29902 RepID=UPI003FCC210C
MKRGRSSIPTSITSFSFLHFLLSMTRSRIRLVLFDAFDTLITPRLPIHRQYAEEANKLGLCVSDDAVRKGFKATSPLLLPRTPPLTAEEWWSVKIEVTMLAAGAEPEALNKHLPVLVERLLTRFGSSEGYRVFDDVIPTLEAFKALGIKTAVLSNADKRILSVLDSLDITPLLTAPPTLSDLCGFSKPDSNIFDFASRQAGVELKEALHIGDELDADFGGSTRAGLHGLLIRREGEFSDGAKREKVENLEGVKVASRLEESVRFVEEWNRDASS